MIQSKHHINMENLFFTKAPTKIDDDVKRLVSLVCPTSKPVYLAVEPENYSEANECISAVEEKIKTEGGIQILGWQLWKSNITIEAEFHAVWRSPSGELKDITPKQIPVSKILFLPDPEIKYEGAQIDNFRLNISGNRLVDDFIKIAERIFRIENKGKRAFQHKIWFTKKEATVRGELKQIQEGIDLMVQNGKTRRSPCFCGSQNNYKHCHGKWLKKQLERL